MINSIMENEIVKKFPIPPFDLDSALKKVKAAEDAWNTKDPEKVVLAYTPDSEWRNRSEFINGRLEIKQFLEKKWLKELEYLYLSLGGIGIVTSVNRLPFVTDRIAMGDLIAPLMLTTAVVIRFLKRSHDSLLRIQV